jgi:hypothetical protein
LALGQSKQQKVEKRIGVKLLLTLYMLASDCRFKNYRCRFLPLLSFLPLAVIMSLLLARSTHALLRMPVGHCPSKALAATASSTSQSRRASHWANIKQGPADKILGLNEAFKADPRPNKVSLVVGAYRDDNGKPVVLPSVKKALDDLNKMDLDHEYANIAGVQSFIDRSIEFAYGKNSPVLTNGRVAAVQALSGTGACRITGEFIATFFGRGKKLHLPNPTVSILITLFMVG